MYHPGKDFIPPQEGGLPSFTSGIKSWIASGTVAHDFLPRRNSGYDISPYRVALTREHSERLVLKAPSSHICNE